MDTISQIGNSEFQCIHCNKQVPILSVGTAHRNHCPFCLWSKHVDYNFSGDRKSPCQGAMEPIGLTFKHEGVDKYGKTKQGELMIVHKCISCEKININRIAGDDKEKLILSLMQQKSLSKEVQQQLTDMAIDLLSENDEKEVKKQLFGIT